MKTFTIGDAVTISNAVNKYFGTIGIVVGFSGWLESLVKVKLTDSVIAIFYNVDLELECSVLDIEKLQQDLFDELIEPAIIANIQNTIEKDDINEAAHQDFLDRMYETGMMMPIGRE